MTARRHSRHQARHACATRAPGPLSGLPGVLRAASRPGLAGLAVAVLAALLAARPARAAEGDGLLEHLKRHTTVGSTVTASGDQNPYAVIVAPVSAGKVREGDVLVDNFNDRNNLQGLGTSIVDYNPQTRAWSVFATIPRHLQSCPGGVGLTAAMTMLRTGWVIVGSLPSTDGTTATKGPGCLVVLDPQGQVAGTFAGPQIDGPWGNMAVIDEGSRATLFVSNTGFGVEAPGQDVVRKATVLRIELSIPDGRPPVVTRQTVIGDGFGEQADKAVFVIGPTGLLLDQDGTLYVSDAVDNRIVAIDHAATRMDSAGTGREVAKAGFMRRPLALVMAPNHHILAVNALNGQVVEIDPATGRQLYAQWIDTDRAQSPPGSGDLFGIAMTPAGDGFFYVEDDMNTLVLAH